MHINTTQYSNESYSMLLRLNPFSALLLLSTILSSSAFSKESESIQKPPDQQQRSTTESNAPTSKIPTDNNIPTVNINSKLKRTQIDIDRKVYDVANDLQSISGSAADILNTIPSVQVDGDGNVALRGDSKVVILIDGKASSQLSGSNAGAGLSQYSASDIEKIEVMTNAPAEFASEGTAGVINIITKRNRQPGSFGAFALNAGNQGRVVSDISGAFNASNLNISGGIGFREDQRQRRIVSTTTTLGQEGAATGFSAEDLHENARRLNPSLKGAINYRVDEKQLLDFDFRLRQRSGRRNYDSQSTSVLSNGSITSDSSGHSDGHEWSLSGEQRLSYKTILTSSEETLAIILHRSTDKERERYLLATSYQIPVGQIGGNQIAQNHYFITDDFSADYRTSPAEGTIIKLGYSLRHDSNGIDFSGNDINPTTGLLTTTSVLKNQFDYQRTIQAIYGSYQKMVNATDVLAGLRVEQTQSEGDQLTSNQINKQNYFGLYPSLHLERKLDQHSTVFSAYSRRLSRPDPEDLNPYIDFRDPQNLRSGNANLQPQQSQSLEAGYKIETDTQNFAISGYLKQIKNGFTVVTTLVAPNVRLTQAANLPLSKSAGVELLADGPLSHTLSYRLSSNLFYTQVDTLGAGISSLQSVTGINLKANLDYRPTTIDTAQLSFSRTDKKLTPQGYIAPLNLVNIGYKRRIQPNLSLILTISDLFNGQRQIRYLNTSQFQTTYDRFQYGRVAYIGFNYSFGTTKKSKAESFDYDQQ
ncbi:TonB-dependent receptor [Undibacterium sp. RTI2.1]|uniref:TonB-dependent receptor domain-containing protein n=1 Tax=unclassified Undibacterium TaxID=2630295 RepID=UPI002B23C5DA|nr:MULTISPECIES: TonB-dependent receptor [unclassified Undibacterium]MEB0032457.1 TonB-dependent receptor [Undibacterium sp. RTI2.1]MEB0118771.1 TonB-dependent receptor [Undibacterium sp. RTI2.2]